MFLSQEIIPDKFPCSTSKSWNIPAQEERAISSFSLRNVGCPPKKYSKNPTLLSSLWDGRAPEIGNAVGFLMWGWDPALGCAVFLLHPFQPREFSFPEENQWSPKWILCRDRLGQICKCQLHPMGIPGSSHSCLGLFGVKSALSRHQFHTSTRIPGNEVALESSVRARGGCS